VAAGTAVGAALRVGVIVTVGAAVGVDPTSTFAPDGAHPMHVRTIATVAAAELRALPELLM